MNGQKDIAVHCQDGKGIESKIEDLPDQLVGEFCALCSPVKFVLVLRVGRRMRDRIPDHYDRPLGASRPRQPSMHLKTEINTSKHFTGMTTAHLHGLAPIPQDILDPPLTKLQLIYRKHHCWE